FVIAMAKRHIPETRDPTISGRLDYAGSLLITLALAGLTFALIQAPAQGLGSAGVVLSIVVAVFAFTAFVIHERRVDNPMIPLDIFSSRQFTSANLVTFVVYAALGGVFFLLVVFLQVVLGYSPLAAGVASAPVTLLLLLLSARAGAISQRYGPRLPLTLGPIVIGIGFLMISTIEPGDSYVTDVLPGILVFGLGLAAVVAPVTATVLAAADADHAGVASATNNAVSRVAGLVAIAVFPLIAGLSGSDLLDPVALGDGFQTAMIAAAVMAIAGGVLAWFTISNDVLDTAPVGDDASSPLRAATDRSCGVAGTPLRPSREASCVPVTSGPPAEREARAPT
ncbi:MAG: MFS transporter, partial [Solirubrobacterales bacterium]